MNQFSGIGRLTKGIEVKTTPTGMSVARFSLALDRGKDKNGEEKGADFPSCIAFGKTAEFLEKWTRKGSRIAVNGRIQTGSYKDKHDVTVYTTEIVVDRVEVIDWNEDAKKENEGRVQEQDIPEGFRAMEADDMPF